MIANEDHTIGVWDIKEGKPIRMLEQIARYPTEAHFVVEDAIILVYSEKLFIGITELGEKLYSFPHGNMKAFSICGKKKDTAVFFMKNRSVFLYDLKTGEKVGQIDTPEELKKITTFGLFSSGKYYIVLFQLHQMIFRIGQDSPVYGPFYSIWYLLLFH